MTEKINMIIKRINGFPPLPAVAVKLLQITGDPDSSAEEIVDVINMDPSFSMETLRLANSPIWGRIAGISSIKEALSLLGISTVRDLVLSKAVFNSFKHTGKIGKVFTKRFWEHSFLCGLAAKMIAEDIKKDNSSCFISGLLHDIGKLIMYLTIPEEFIRVLDLPEDRLFRSYDNELRLIGITHGQTGALLLKRWLFPPDLISAVGFHHVPAKVTKNHTLPMIINIADIIVNCTQIQNDIVLEDNIYMALINESNIKFLKACNLSWNGTKLKQYVDRLTLLKEDNKDALSLFL